MKNNPLDKSVQPIEPRKTGKAPYAKPVLRVFGSVKNLTKGHGGSVPDGYSPGNRRFK